MTGRDAWDAWYAWLSQLEHYADGVELAMPRTAQGLRDVIAAMPDLKSHDAEVAAAAWDEGYTRGFYDREVMHGEVRDASEGPSDNPYRADESNPYRITHADTRGKGKP